MWETVADIVQTKGSELKLKTGVEKFLEENKVTAIEVSSGDKKS